MTVSASRLGLVCVLRSPTQRACHAVTSPTFELVLDKLEYEGIMSNVSVITVEPTSLVMPVVKV